MSLWEYYESPVAIKTGLVRLGEAGREKKKDEGNEEEKAIEEYVRESN